MAASHGVFKILYLGAGVADTPDMRGMEAVLRALPPDALSRGQRTLLTLGADVVVSAWSDGVVLQNWPLLDIKLLATAGRLLYLLDAAQNVHFFLSQNGTVCTQIAQSIVGARRAAKKQQRNGPPPRASAQPQKAHKQQQPSAPLNGTSPLQFDKGNLFANDRTHDLASASRFSKEEITRLNRYFLERCPDGKANPIEFAQLYASLHKSSLNDVQEYTDLVFKTFDIDHDGCINFTEYIAFLGITARGTGREKFGLIFDTHDINQDGQLSREEVQKMAASIYNLSKVPGYSGPPPPLTPEELSEILFSSFDAEQTGFIGRDDFIECCEQDELLASLVDLSLKNRRGSDWVASLPLETSQRDAAQTWGSEPGTPTPSVSFGNPQAEILAAELTTQQSPRHRQEEESWHAASSAQQEAEMRAAEEKRRRLEEERRRLQEEEEQLRIAAEQQARQLEEQRRLAEAEEARAQAEREKKQRELEERRRQSVKQAAQQLHQTSVSAKNGSLANQQQQQPQMPVLTTVTSFGSRKQTPANPPPPQQEAPNPFALTRAAKSRQSVPLIQPEEESEMQIDAQCSFLGNCRCLDCLQERGELGSFAR